MENSWRNGGSLATGLGGGERCRRACGYGGIDPGCDANGDIVCDGCGGCSLVRVGSIIGSSISVVRDSGRGSGSDGGRVRKPSIPMAMVSRVTGMVMTLSCCCYVGRGERGALLEGEGGGRESEKSSRLEQHVVHVVQNLSRTKGERRGLAPVCCLCRPGL